MPTFRSNTKNEVERGVMIAIFLCERAGQGDMRSGRAIFYPRPLILFQTVI